MQLPRLLPLLMVYGLTACALQTASGLPTNTLATEKAAAGISKEAVCGVWKDIIFSRHTDSLVTIEQVKENNAARDAFCN